LKKDRKSRSDSVIKKFGLIIIFQNIKKFDNRIPRRFKRKETLGPLISMNHRKNQK